MLEEAERERPIVDGKRAACHLHAQGIEVEQA